MNRKERPILCPCPNSCTPIYNGLAFDDRVKTGDMMEGYSGDCIGCGDKQEFVIGGNKHTNDMNHCVFTPLKGITRYQINKDDISAMLYMCKKVLNILEEKKCESCGACHSHVHFVITDNKRLCCHCYYQGKGGLEGQTEE